MEEVFSESRLKELADQADRSGRLIFSPFLTPVEVKTAHQIAKKMGMDCIDYGGYEAAERRMVCFGADEAVDFPIRLIRILWPKQEAPLHKDILGAVMGLGVKRSVTGDIVLCQQEAFLFVEEKMTSFILQNLSEAGRIHLQLQEVDHFPELSAPQGETIHMTVMSLRLDAVISMGFHLSRSKAEELIRAGLAKKNYQPCTKPDEKIKEGDLISLHRYGRLRIEIIGTMNRKGRLAVEATRFSVEKRK